MIAHYLFLPQKEKNNYFLAHNLHTPIAIHVRRKMSF